ncbi:RNase H domain-containing protein [Trichonephila clavipes]|nr:RNase H domain-containing protein [Trichonephila clavipes]
MIGASGDSANVSCRYHTDNHTTRSATTELPLRVPHCNMKRVIQHRIDNAWQESWNLQTNNKLHCVKPVIAALPVMPMRKTDIKLT